MSGKRPKRHTGVFWACLESSAQGRTEHRPTSADYPDSVVRRVSFTAGGGLGWKLSALETPRAQPTPWKIVVITGAPSWAEYWAPVLATLPNDREMVVVDRPGFAASEPFTCVPDLQLQADALSPLLLTAPGQRLLLVGQSYGAAIATLMAARHPRGLGGLVLLSSYLGELGPTGRWLIGLGSHATGVIPRDLRNAITEVTHQRDQLALMRRFLPRLRVSRPCGARRNGRLRAYRGRAAPGARDPDTPAAAVPGRAGRQSLSSTTARRSPGYGPGAMHSGGQASPGVRWPSFSPAALFGAPQTS